MTLLKEIEIENFKCFRKPPVKISLGQGSYLIGPNNSGKTAILAAIRVFFGQLQFTEELLNKTVYAAKKGGYNASSIGITFNIDAITRARRQKKQLQLEFGSWFKVTKYFKYQPISQLTKVSYEIIGEKKPSIQSYDSREEFDTQQPEISKILNHVHISYIHPQEGRELILNVQKKLKERLLLNWGRSALGGLTVSLDELRTAWKNVREDTTKELSRSLSNNVQRLWPGSKTFVSLPK